MIQVGNAPCSWGTIEGFEASPIAYDQMLDELKVTGYQGTELGDLGFMPTDPERLRDALRARDLVMLGGYEGVPLAAEALPERVWERIDGVAGLLAACADLSPRPPYFILADANNTDPVRTEHAGRTTADMSLDADGWTTFVANAAAIARRVADRHGIPTLFHHHCAAFVERHDEIERFLDGTSDASVDLVFDTGHYTYGSGHADDDGTLALDGLERFWERVRYVHFKDCDPDVARRARDEGWDYPTAVGAGVFCELGKGSIDFAAIVAWLRERGYDDWITVEQDVLPGMGTPKESARRNREFLRSLGL